MEISAAIASSHALSKLLLPCLAHGPTAAAAVRADPYRSACAPRALVRRTRRARRKSLDSGDAGDDLFSGDGDDGPFGGGGSGSGGRGWNFGGDGGADWEDDNSRRRPPSSSLDPAFDFVYEVVLWIALSNCTHFAVKKLARILQERGKVESMRLVPSMC